VLDPVESKSAAPGGGGEPIRVLAVEDAPMNLFLIKAYLKGPRYTLETASNGAIAVEKFQAGEFDIVLMDVQMPVMDGHTATQTIRAWEREHHKRPTPILALTAHSAPEQHRESLAAGCNAHLVKPVSKAVLLEAVQTFTTQARADTPAPSRPERILVKVPEGVEEAVPLFLEMAREDLQNLGDALRKADYARIRFIGHDLKGSGGGYGFDGVSVIGKLLEDAAKRSDPDDAGRQIAALAEYLDRVEVV
jgi:CheY-like chemotaxis protein/HPt (histidine-containing phosphotransfer) domain-containing protein